MKEYIFTIIAVSIVSGIITSMFPSNSSLKKHIKFVSGLISAIALLSPIAVITSKAYLLSENINIAIEKLDINNKVSQSNKIIINEGIEQISDGIKNAVANKFSLSEESIDISITVDDKDTDAVILKKVIITLSNTATWSDGYEIEKYTENLIGCDVTVMKK